MTTTINPAKVWCMDNEDYYQLSEEQEKDFQELLAEIKDEHARYKAWGEMLAYDDYFAIGVPMWRQHPGCWDDHKDHVKNAYVKMYNRLLDSAGYQPQYPEYYSGAEWK